MLIPSNCFRVCKATGFDIGRESLKLAPCHLMRSERGKAPSSDIILNLEYLVRFGGCWSRDRISGSWENASIDS
jgi:hypothetical protein